ncbi:hypothetical protein FA09DRAFT_338038 [Tilletiopsis washingtonensis]|uniref:Chromo domain-containing protein n=1 Tax=Tilletiopsis washingtonensis TaxID=58919 RepID=A0A316ZEQ6_9BASI|nr:hypothetical protein FA09DRAFT_338038 [Tilletiopsis washingtonensis]PWN98743.1 hypothetical protein FA09DRAFT_338038 [Tilletiopsis washingtonensis]
MPRSSRSSDSPAAPRASVPGSSRASSAKGSAQPQAKAAPVALALSDDDEASDEAGASDGGESAEEPEYEIEKILGHRHHRDSSGLTYKIRWKGYEASDDTWEPESHVQSTASELTRKYWARVKKRADPRDAKVLKHVAGLRAAEKKRPRPHSKSPPPAAAEDDEEATSPRAAKKARGSDEAAPAESADEDDEDGEAEAEKRRAEAASRKKYDKLDNWENECNVETLERSEDGELSAYIRFKDGAELSYPASVAYKKCPQRTLKFYERHLHFRRAHNDS